MSPILFSLFVEDLQLYLQQDVHDGIYIDDLVLIMLLFADDMAIVGKTPLEIQNQLDRLLHIAMHGDFRLIPQKLKLWFFVNVVDYYPQKGGPTIASL